MYLKTPKKKIHKQPVIPFQGWRDGNQVEIHMYVCKVENNIYFKVKIREFVPKKTFSSVLSRKFSNPTSSPLTKITLFITQQNIILTADYKTRGISVTR